MRVHVPVIQRNHAADLVLHLVDVGEPQLHEAGIDRPRVVLFLELADEGGGQQTDPVLELADEGGGQQTDPVLVVLQQGEIVLVDVDGLMRAHLHAFAAINALVVADDRLSVPDADGTGRAGTHAGGAPPAKGVINPEGMSEVCFSGSHCVVKSDKRSW